MSWVPSRADLEAWERTGTPAVDEFLRYYNTDDNVWWVIACGHHQNLFEQAVDERDALQARIAAALAILAQHDSGEECSFLLYEELSKALKGSPS